MELREFITDTIKQITDAIHDADKYIKKKSVDSEGIRDEYRSVRFDVAVTTNEGENDKIGAKVSVAHIFNAGGSSESSNATSNTSRIQFEILIHVSTGEGKI
jgi:hypothetical protein